MLIEGEEDDLLGGVAFPAHILLLIDLYEAIAATIRMRCDYRAIIIG